MDVTMLSEGGDMKDEENLIRLKYLLQNSNVEKNVKFLLQYAFKV